MGVAADSPPELRAAFDRDGTVPQDQPRGAEDAAALEIVGRGPPPDARVRAAEAERGLLDRA